MRAVQIRASVGMSSLLIAVFVGTPMGRVNIAGKFDAAEGVGLKAVKQNRFDRCSCPIQIAHTSDLV